MCELLIKAFSHTHINPVKNVSGCYKQGDIIDLRPDGFEWGKEEGLPKFFILQCMELKHDERQEYKIPQTETVSVADKTQSVIVKRRKFMVDLERLDPKIFSELINNGRAKISLEEFNKVLIDKTVK